MCPPMSASLPVTFDNDLNDDKIFSYIFKSKRDHLLPSNLRKDVNPFSIEPWRVQEKTWFLCNSEQLISSDGQEIRIVGSGYWKPKKTCEKIFSSESHEGRKIYWEFYDGIVPCGSRTGWILLEYKKGPKELPEDVTSNFNSLCIVYRQQIDAPLFEVESIGTSANDAEADHLQSILFGIADDNDEEENIQHSASNSMQVEHDDQEKIPTSNISRDTAPEYHVDLNPSHLDGDFIELKDFDDVESSSFSSENSSALSKSSDECFDSEAVLLDLKKDEFQITGQDGQGCNQTCFGTTGSEEVVKELRQDVGDDHEEKSVPPSSCSKEKHKGKREKRAASRSPSSSGSSHGSTCNFGRRVAKYCGFSSP